MNKFTKLNISAIPKEEAHGGSGARKVLVKPEHVASPYLEAVTKGFLKPGNIFDWHFHQDTDEIFISIEQNTHDFGELVHFLDYSGIGKS